MALKRQHDMMAAFSMASMTDVVFLLLIFFMVTSTFVFPTALEINLPQSSEQTAIKPATRIFIDRDNNIYVAFAADDEPRPVDTDQLLAFLTMNPVDSTAAAASGDFIAVYADDSVTYGRLVEVLDLGARNNLKMVLATKPAPQSMQPAQSSSTAQ